MGERIQRWVKMEGTDEGNSETDVRGGSERNSGRKISTLYKQTHLPTSES